MLINLIGAIVSGLIFGALGRLAIPGPNPMSVGMTILVGMAGAFIGNIVGYLLLGRGAGLFLGTAGAALVVVIVERVRKRR